MHSPSTSSTSLLMPDVGVQASVVVAYRILICKILLPVGVSTEPYRLWMRVAQIRQSCKLASREEVADGIKILEVPSPVREEWMGEDETSCSRGFPVEKV